VPATGKLSDEHHDDENDDEVEGLTSLYGDVDFGSVGCVRNRAWPVADLF
jgi:hypothetical protein